MIPFSWRGRRRENHSTTSPFSNRKRRRERHGKSARRSLKVEHLEARALLSSGDLLVQLRPGMEHRAKELTALVGNENTVRPTEIRGLYQIQADAASMDRVAKSAKGLDYVQYVETEQAIVVDVTANDPAFTNGTLYGLSGTWGIQAPKAWDVTTGSPAVIVADIDSGVDYNHPDLYLNIWLNEAEIPLSRKANLTDVDSDGIIGFRDLNDARNQGPFKITDTNGDGRITGKDVLAPMNRDAQGKDLGAGGWSFPGNTLDGDTAHPNNFIGWNFITNTNDPMDDHGHGTHTSGTIGAIGNNGLGLTGVAWNTQIMPLKFLGSNGSGSDLAAAYAVRYAADHGAQVSNNSWGGGGGGTTLYNSIQYAGSKGQVFVAAAGNDGQNNDAYATYPASFNLGNIITVAATDSSGRLASFSNYGAKSVDVGAPGVGIYSTLPNNRYASWNGTSMATPHVAGTVALVMAQHPEWSVSQVISQILTTTKPASSLAGRTVTGGIVNAGEAVGAAYEGPLTRVSTGSTAIADGAGSVDFGRTTLGDLVTKTFTVTNGGTQNLVFGSTITVPAGFTVMSGFGTTTVAPGGTTTFAVSMSAAAEGTLSGQISFTSNDTQRSPFNFAVSGSVSSAAILDNGDPGFRIVAGSFGYNGTDTRYYQHDHHYAAKGTGGAGAEWAFSNLTTGGTYQVWTTWLADPNRATNALYKVIAGSTSTPVRINQQAAPNDLTDDGAMWESLATVTLPSGVASLNVQLWNDANGYVIVDGVRIQEIRGPEIEVTTETMQVTDGQSTIQFGSPWVGSTVAKTLTVTNRGTESLTLGQPITVPAGYTVTDFGQTTLAPNQSTTFTVTLAASTPGTYNGSLSLATNDVDENPFNINLAGTVDTRKIIDNDTAGFTVLSGNWIVGRTYPGYYGNTHRYHAPAANTNLVSWTFNGLQPGLYNVAVTWLADPNRPTAVPYTVSSGASTATSKVNQRLAPADLTADGTKWKVLSSSFVVPNGSSSLTVKMGADPTGYAIADAVRLEYVGAPLTTVTVNGASKPAPTTPGAGAPNARDALLATILDWNCGSGKNRVTRRTA